MTEGGADYCFECVGRASIVHEAFDCCRKVSNLIYRIELIYIYIYIYSNLFTIFSSLDREWVKQLF